MYVCFMPNKDNLMLCYEYRYKAESMLKQRYGQPNTIKQMRSFIEAVIIVLII